MVVSGMSKTTSPPYPRIPSPKRWQSNYHGGHCTECGGTGRDGCSPCSQCKGHGHTMQTVDEAFEAFANRILGRPDPNDPPTHFHKCGECGFIWEHETDCVNNTTAHTCRECGTEEWFWFHGETAGAPFITCALTTAGPSS